MAFCYEGSVYRLWTRQMLAYLIFNIAYLLFATFRLRFVLAQSSMSILLPAIVFL